MTSYSKRKTTTRGTACLAFQPTNFNLTQVVSAVNGSEELLLGVCFRNPPENVKAEAFIIVNIVKLFFFVLVVSRFSPTKVSRLSNKTKSL